MHAFLTLCTLAAAMPQASDHWQVQSNAATYGPLDLESGGPTQSAYLFSVEAKPDGSLPMVQTPSAHLLLSNSSSVFIVKKRPSGKYALHAILNKSYFRPNAAGGLILAPGDYGYVYNAPSPPYTPAHGLVLLTGRWVGGAEQNNYWSVNASTFPTLFPLSAGGNDSGFRFTVDARPDGKIPALEQCTAQATSTPSIVTLYRLNGAGTYDFWARIDMSNSRPDTIAQLPPGSYALSSFTDSLVWGSTRAFCVVMTGRYVDP